MKRPLDEGSVVVLGMLLVGFIAVIAAPRFRPELIPAHAGCFQGRGDLSGVSMNFGADGYLRVQGAVVRYRVQETKQGLSFVPAESVLYDRRSPRRLMIGGEGGQVIRLVDNDAAVIVGGDTPHPLFVRAPCPAVG